MEQADADGARPLLGQGRAGQLHRNWNRKSMDGSWMAEGRCNYCDCVRGRDRRMVIDENA